MSNKPEVGAMFADIFEAFGKQALLPGFGEPAHADDIEKKWNVAGLPCMVVRYPMGHYCGYVLVPESHPWYGKDYDDEALDGVKVHGCLTFAGTPNPVDGGHWFGFDTAHAGDTPSCWPLDAVARETESLARQLAEAAT